MFSKAYWYLKNLISYSGADKVIEEYYMPDYNYYWSQVMKKGLGGGSYPIIIDILESRINNDAKLLDIGCGNGELIRSLSNRLNIECLGIDISEKAIQIAMNKGINTRIFDIFTDDFKKLGAFNYITMFEVLEHIPNAEQAIINIRDNFKSEIAFFSIPNSGSLYERMRLLRGRFPKQWVVHPGEHVRFWTLHDFKFMLRGLGIKIINVYGISHNHRPINIGKSLFSQMFIFEVKL